MQLMKPAVVLASAALMTLAACGGGGGSNGGPGAGASFRAGGGAGAAKNADAKAPMAVPDGAQKGGTLTVLTANAPSTLRPDAGLLHGLDRDPLGPGHPVA